MPEVKPKLAGTVLMISYTSITMWNIKIKVLEKGRYSSTNYYKVGYHSLSCLRRKKYQHFCNNF